MKMKKEEKTSIVRVEPKAGDIIAVPLGGDEWTYLCYLRLGRCYVYDFVSKGLLSGRSPAFRAEKPWLTWLYVTDMPLEFATIGRRKLVGDEICPPTVYKAPERRDLCKEYGHPETDWWMSSLSYSGPVSSAEASKYPDTFMSVKASRFRQWFQPFKCKMTVLEGSRGKLPPLAPPEDLREVAFLVSGYPDTFGTSDIFDAVVEELDQAGISYDHNSETVIVDRDDAKVTLDAIRGLMKRIVPGQWWPFVEILTMGPKRDQSEVHGLDPPKDGR